MFLQVELEEPEIESHKQKAYRKLVQQAVIPGFRKGKAPRSILERYLGVETFMQEGLEELLETSANEAVEQENLDAVGRPEITDVESLDPITFKATIPLTPLSDLGDFRSIRVPWEQPGVKDEDVQEALENVRRQGTPWEPVEDRPVQAGDLVTLTAKGTVPGGEEDEADVQTFLEEDGMSFPVQEGASWPVAGFAEQLVGLERDTDKEFTLALPDDHPNEALQGKEGSFTVRVTEVKEQQLPEMDDEWAKGVMDGFDTMVELRERVESDLRTQAESRADADYEEQVLDALEEQAKLEFPPIMVETEIDHMLQDQDERMRQIGVSLADYAARTGQEPSELRESLREQAEKRVVRSLIVSELTEQIGIEATEDDIDEEIERLLESQGADEAARQSAAELFSQEAARDTVRRRLVARKAVDHFTTIAKGEDSPDPAAEEQEESPSENADEGDEEE